MSLFDAGRSEVSTGEREANQITEFYQINGMEEKREPGLTWKSDGEYSG